MPGTDDPVRWLSCVHEWSLIYARDIETRERIIDRDQRYHEAERKRRILDRASRDWKKRHPDAPE